MINPNDVTTIRVGELPSEPFSLTDNIPHEVGISLKRGTIQELSTFIAAYIGSSDGVGFRAISVTDGQTLPTTTKEEFILVGKGTFYNVAGGSTIICTEELNAIVSNAVYWFIGVEIPINVELAGITQFIREGFTTTTPSEDAIFKALELKGDIGTFEEVDNKISTITNYSEILYPNEKATHDALDAKLNISDLPSNLTLYATNVPSGVLTYTKWVSTLNDPDYNTTAVNISTGAISGTAQLISGLSSIGGQIVGNPGIINVTTVGNIRRTSGTGTAKFYFELYKRTSAGVETLLGVSDFTLPVDFNTYAEFSATAVWNDGIFIETDRIVIKFFGSRIAGGGDPTFDFQFGGLTPVRTIVPVPFRVLASEYELKSNKQNSLAVDGTGLKYPNVTAVNVGLALKANLASPTFTGVPLAPTATAGTNTTQIATTAFVTANTNAGGLLEFNATDRTIWNNGKGDFATNTSFGDSALKSITVNGNETAYGSQSLLNLVSGTDNTSIGRQSGGATSVGNLTISNQSVFLGSFTKSLNDSETNQIVIGYNAIGAGSNTATLGNASITKTVLRGAVETNGSFINSTAPATNALLANGTTLANPISGTGTTGYIQKTTSTGVIGDSNFFDAGAQSQIRAGQLYVGNPNTTNTNNVYIEIGSTTTPPNIQGAKAGVGTAPLHLQRDGGNVIINGGTDNGVDKLQVSGTVKALYLKTNLYTVSTLPTPTGTAYATVSDALAPSYMVTVVGGGAVVTPVFYNGTNWVAH